MSSDVDEVKVKLINIGKLAAKKKLVWANSGNISLRLDDNTFIISVSGAYLENLSEEDFVVIDLEGNIIEGMTKPSMETKMHSVIYRTNFDFKSVFHSQAFFTTLLSCTDIEVDPNLFPEAMAYLKNIFRISYNHPGSLDLADEVFKKITQSDVLILNNHGAICAGVSPSDVLLKTETLEMLCKMITFSRVSDLNMNYLPQDLKEDLLEHLEQMEDSL